MAYGPGKYDDLATYVREQSQADGVIVIVYNGNKGQGFSCQVTDLRIHAAMPSSLRAVADQIEGKKQ